MSGLIKPRVLLIAGFVLLSFSAARGEEPREAPRASGELTRDAVESITMLGIREDGTRYRAPQPQLLMEFFDPERGRNLERSQAGALWAWGEGRPIALAEVWRWNSSGPWGHVLISTAPGHVNALIDGRAWAPEQPGLRFVELANAPAPAEAVAERMSQMSQLASRFTGFEMIRRQLVDLQMLPDPLLIYQEEGADGAIFALANNGNPAALLFIEAVRDPIRPSYWKYAWVKATSSPVTVELEGNELLHIPGALNERGSDSEPFWVFFRPLPSE